MSNPSARRILRLIAPCVVLALTASVTSFGVLAGQEAAPDDVPASFLEVIVPSAEVTVLGDGLLAGSAVAPLRPGPCRVSESGPVEVAARGSLDTTVAVDNLACAGASIADLARLQLPFVAADTDVVFLGGLALEFDWPALSAACLARTTANAAACAAEAGVARATAANSFFSWRSILQQIERTAEAATIVVVGAPYPVSERSSFLGGECCGVRVDANNAVRAVFDTAEAARRAVVNSLPGSSIVYVDSVLLFSGRETDAKNSLLSPIGFLSSGADALPGAAGTRLLSDAIRTLIPAAEAPAPIARGSQQIAVVLGETTADVSTISSFAEGANEWFDRTAAGATEMSVAIFTPSVTPPPLPDPTEDPDTTPPTDGDDSPPPPADDDPPVDDPPVDDPPADDSPPLDDPPVDDQPPADEDPPAVEEPELEQDPTDVEAPVAPVPLTPDFFDDTTAESLSTRLATLAPVDGITTIDDLITTLEAVADLPWKVDASRYVVISVGEIDTEAGPQPLLDALGLLQADIRFMLPDSEAAASVASWLIDTGVSVSSLDQASLVDQLPLPDPKPDLLTMSVAPVVAAMTSQSIELAAIFTMQREAIASVDWSLDGTLIATGQRATIAGGSLDEGSHVFTVTATSEAATLSREVIINVSVDGDGQSTDDTCPADFDPDSTDTDDDGIANACDSDDDNDGLPDRIDPCPTAANTRLFDTDLDQRPNVCDGDSADGPNADFDGDFSPDVVDNCPAVANRTQADRDSDGVGDACQTASTSSINCTITGTSGNDRLVGTQGADVICGLGGNDVLIGRGGDDILLGGAGNDRIRAGAGADRVIGGTGDDRLFGNAGPDIIIGGPGVDNLEGGVGNDSLHGGGDDDRLAGGTGNDLLVGDGGSDRLVGGQGNDSLSGGGGVDEIWGGPGDDVLEGGAGVDDMRGGGGRDLYIANRIGDRTEDSGGENILGGPRPTLF